VIVRTYKPVDKFGRYLADVIVGGADLAELLVEAKLATPYEGGHKTPVPVEET
jgi:endonuclease YncB( thermonuclease family)